MAQFARGRLTQLKTAPHFERSITITMKTPRIFVAYAPRGAGLRCALFYLSDRRDAHGWFTGPREDASFASAYFFIENFYTSGQERYVEIEPGELYSRWTEDEAMRHELARQQDAFVHEWLFFRADPGAAAELETYARAELATGEVNIRYERLAKLSKLQPNWTYYSQGFARSVLRFLMKRWPLEYREE
jgi:hypothetical protein